LNNPKLAGQVRHPVPQRRALKPPSQGERVRKFLSPSELGDLTPPGIEVDYPEKHYERGTEIAKDYNPKTPVSLLPL